MTAEQQAIVDSLADSCDDGYVLMPETVALFEGVEVVDKALGACVKHMSQIISQMGFPARA